MKDNRIIDLRSDTVTKPTPAMLEYMMNAEVGDDVWGDDPTVIKLQNLICEISGKEAALYVPSGTMSNQIAIAAATNSGDEIICEAQAHIVKYEGGAPAYLSRVNTKQIKSQDGTLELEEIEELIRPNDIHFPVSKMLCIENTHNSLGGRILPLDYIKSAEKIARNHGLHFHCDGARLWNASIATGISIKDYCAPFDSVSLCLSKGLGAPVGSVLTGKTNFIDKAKRLRKMFGGGMRQSGIIAAAGIYAVNHNFAGLSNDHVNAKKFATMLHQCHLIKIDTEKIETNIVYFKYPDNVSENDIISALKQENILIGAAGKNTLRAVFHLQISEEATVYAANAIIQFINQSNLRNNYNA